MTTELITIINELSIGADGWAQIAPFGDYAGVAMVPDGKGGFTKERAIQRLDKIAVTQMANEYQRSSRGLSGFFKKRPLYEEGHPDIPVGGSQYPNKHPVGLFHNLACRDGGLYGEPILTDDGEKLIASKTYRALSGRWAAEFVGQEDGVNIYRPVKFLSAGLTNQPNLPVELLNETDSSADRTRTTHHATVCSSAGNHNHEPKPNMTKIIAWLSRQGITLANDATDEQVETALAQLDPRLQTNDTHGQFANERKARIESELNRAVRDGRIAEADRATWQQRLASEAQFTNELAALEALKPVIKTHSLTLGRGDRKIELANARDRRGLVAEVLAEIANELELDLKKSEHYDRAWTEAQKRHPALFDAMSRPQLHRKK